MTRADARLHPHSRGAPEQSARARPRPPAARARGGDRRVRLRQVLAGVRYGVRRGSAPLRRDLLAVCAAVPRPDGQAAGRPHRRNPARDRDRPDEPRADLALDGRYDDRAQRSSEAVVRACRAASLPQLRCAGPSRYGAEHRRRCSGARTDAHRPAADRDLPGRGARQLQRGRGTRPAREARLHASARAARPRARDRPGPAAPWLAPSAPGWSTRSNRR